MITTPPHNKTCFCSDAGIMWGFHTHNRSPPWPGFRPRLEQLRAQCSTYRLHEPKGGINWPKWQYVIRAVATYCGVPPLSVLVHLNRSPCLTLLESVPPCSGFRLVTKPCRRPKYFSVFLSIDAMSLLGSLIALSNSVRACRASLEKISV